MRHGEPFHGEVVTGDASGGIAFALYKAGTVTPYVLKANEFISITDILLSMAAAGTYSIVADTATPGQYICTGLANALAKGEVTWHATVPLVCPQGITPVLLAAIGNVACIISGYITEV